MHLISNTSYRNAIVGSENYNRINYSWSGFNIEEVGAPWILSGGVWDDDNFWIDTEKWKD